MTSFGTESHDSDQAGEYCQTCGEVVSDYRMNYSEITEGICDMHLEEMLREFDLETLKAIMEKIQQ